MKQHLGALAIVSALAIVPTSVVAEGNLASQPTELNLEIDGVTLSFSETEYELEMPFVQY